MQQFEWGFRTYDSQTEQPVPGELARFDVNLDEADAIRREQADLRVVDGELVITVLDEAV